MRAALVVGHGVNLIDDQGPRRSQHFARSRGGQQDEQRFRRGHQNVRRVLPHALTFGGGRVSGAHRGADFRQRNSLRASQRSDAFERSFEVLANIVAQGFERRDVDHLGLVGQLAQAGLAHQIVNRGEECRERFSGAGGRGNQNVAAGADLRPAELLRLRRRGEASLEPFADQGIERSERHRFDRTIRVTLW